MLSLALCSVTGIDMCHVSLFAHSHTPGLLLKVTIFRNPNPEPGMGRQFAHGSYGSFVFALLLGCAGPSGHNFMIFFASILFRRGASAVANQEEREVSRSTTKGCNTSRCV